MLTRILSVTDESVAEAVKILKSGGVIGMPTETVYGLAAIGTMPKAVKKIYEIKGRPSDNPLIAHVHEDYDLEKLVRVDNAYAYELKKRFTPGPLTMVFYGKGVVCREAVCGGDTLAVRIPSHEGAKKLLRAVDAPLVAPSANLSKHTSPVTARQVYDDLSGKLPLILDGGKCSGGIESTVLDVTGAVPRILRPGLITREMIESVTGVCEIAEHKQTDKVRSPGVKYRHYRPKCETALFSEDCVDKAVKLYNETLEQGKTPFIMCSDAVARGLNGKNLLMLGATAEDMAANLYDKLLEGEKKADIIIAVYTERTDGVYLGLTNRIRKSCG